MTVFHDAELFIAEAIESVLTQTRPDLEILLVDDGSHDGSGAIARRFVAEHPGRIRYLHHANHRNLGISASRNLALRQARGVFVSFLDADDAWLPTKLADQLRIMETVPEASMVYGNRQYWRSWANGARGGDSMSTHGIPGNRLYRPPELLVLTYGRGLATNPGSDVLCRRDAALRVGGFEDDLQGMFEDQAFLVKVYCCEPVFVADACWTRYRQHPRSMVAAWSASEEAAAARRVFLAWAGSYLSAHGFGMTETGRALRRALWSDRHPHLSRVGRILTGRLPRGSLAAIRGAMTNAAVLWTPGSGGEPRHRGNRQS